MLENAVYSVISPEGCASILWKDASKAAEAAQSLKLTAEDAKRLGVVDRIIPEKSLGKDDFYISLKQAVYERLSALRMLPAPTLLDRRYERFRALGMSNIMTNNGGLS